MKPLRSAIPHDPLISWPAQAEKSQPRNLHINPLIFGIGLPKKFSSVFSIQPSIPESK